MKMHFCGWTCLLAVLSVVSLAGAQVVLVEAESFADPGGWVTDTQSMDQMGSPYLLAHGLGEPVKDATTTAAFPAAGKYRLFVRTRDWVAPWKAPGAPGKFQLLIEGKAVPTTFGTEGADWHWQDGGTVEIGSTKAALALHDLTGFEGRCDAILFSADANFTPPNSEPALTALRRQALGLSDKPADGGSYDLVVTGGGIAGTCAAVAAARMGVKVALVQDRPVLGGNNSSEVRVWLGGAVSKEPWPHVGDLVKELEPQKRGHGSDNKAEYYEDDKRIALAKAEPNLTVFLNHRVIQAETSGGRIAAVVAQEIPSGKRVRFAGKWFADCTGDAAVGFLAGAHYEATPTGHMGQSNLWTTANTGAPVSFPRCPWALDLSHKPFPGRDGDVKKMGVWYWETGFDYDPIEKREFCRDWNLRAMYGAWDALKNVEKKLPNHKISWAAYISGPRESRRLLGDVVLTKEDVVKGKKYPDGCVPTGWSIDLHLPDPKYVKGFEGDAFISQASFGKYTMPYWVPYRCLYSRNVPNLFMAGRDISVTHEALGCVRVMRTTGLMGEVVGMAAAVCKKYNADPRGVYAEHLAELQDLMKRGVGKNAK